MKRASMPECAFIHTCGLKRCATCSIAEVSGSLRARAGHMSKHNCSQGCFPWQHPPSAWTGTQRWQMRTQRCRVR